MDRLTTDTPKNNFETLLNLVYGKDGWGYIRHGDEDMKVTDFCMMLCNINECTCPPSPLDSDERKDEHLCECAYDGCIVASVYAALCGFCHVRSRLKLYEDAGVMPPCKEK